MNYQNTLAFAQSLDQQDPLKQYQAQFLYPEINGKKAIYFCGNSLGLQPKSTINYLQEVLNDWATLGVKGHFHAENKWYHYHKLVSTPAAQIVGAKPDEVTVMNTLTVNLHLLLASFYRPTSKRYKILIEAPAFTSDRYVVASQVEFHGFSREDAVVELYPRAGEHTLRSADILQAIEALGDELALVLFGGVNYYTGQLFDIPAITKATHQVGAIAGFDLAHAAGNVPMQLHDWNVDFAAWCTYKYLNSSPGGVSGVFVHERHGNNLDTPRLAGWWGNDESVRFQMPDRFTPQKGAAGWQTSNSPILLMAAHRASLELFKTIGMTALRQKSELLTNYLEFILEDINQRATQKVFTVITPKESAQRGCQLSILTNENGYALFEHLSAAGVIMDWRKPNVIRVAPTPMYNRFEEVYRFGALLEEALELGVRS